jgi:hypothetical protein
MKNYNLNKLLTNSWLRITCLLIAFVWAVLVFLFGVFYEKAKIHLVANNPATQQNISELKVYFAPLSIKVGEIFTVNELIEYFDELFYLHRTDEVPGSYKVDKNTVKFIPISEAFPSAEIVFSKHQVKKIIIAGKAVEKIEIEPLPMRNFIKYVNEERLPDLKAYSVRRIVLSPESIPKRLSEAFTAAEDKRFFDHHGLDVFGILYRLATRRGGGSSITQQLIKNNVIKGSSEEFWQTYLGFLPPTYQRKISRGGDDV